MANCQEQFKNYDEYTMQNAIFDKDLYTMQKQRASTKFKEHDFIFQHVAADLTKRFMEDFGHETFANALIYGHFGITSPNIGKITRAALVAEEGIDFCYDEENIPFNEANFDLIVSNLSLHCVNDVLGALIQYRRLLKPNGLFISTIFGGATLQELRQAFLQADSKYYNAVSPRVIPFIDIKTAALLLRKAGFVFNVADTYIISVQYDDIMKLIRDIKGMGEANCLLQRRMTPAAKGYFNRIAQEYPRTDDKLNASVEVITVVGRNLGTS